MSSHVSTYLVKVNDQGMLTIEMPQMAGKYILVEQHGGQLVITPFDLTTDPKTGAIAQMGREFTLLGTQAKEVPVA